MLVPGNASSTAAPSVRSVSWRKRRKVASNPANGGDLREFQYLVLEPEFVLMMVERVSEVAERRAKATRHTFLLPEHTRCEGPEDTTAGEREPRGLEVTQTATADAEGPSPTPAVRCTSDRLPSRVYPLALILILSRGEER